jgi:hypothetical protein
MEHQLRTTHPDVFDALEVVALRYLHVKHKLTPIVPSTDLVVLRRELMALGISPTQDDYDRQLAFAAREAIWKYIEPIDHFGNRYDGRALQLQREHGVMRVGEFLDLVAARLSPTIRDSLLAEARAFGARQR